MADTKKESKMEVRDETSAPEVEVVEYLIGVQFGLSTDEQDARSKLFKQALGKLLGDGFSIVNAVSAPHPVGGSVVIYTLVR